MAFPMPTWVRGHRMLLTGLLLTLIALVIPAGFLVHQWLTARSAKALGASNPRDDRLLLSEYTLLVHALAFSPDGTMLATLAAVGKAREQVPEIRLWDCSTGEELRRSQDIPDRIGSVAFSPDGKTLACGGGTRTSGPKGSVKESGAVWIWDLGTDRPALWQKTDRLIHSVVFNPKGNTLAVCDNTPVITLYNRTTGRTELSLRPGSGALLPSNLAFSQDGKRLACGYLETSNNPKLSHQGVVQVWEAGDGKPLTLLHLPKTRDLVPFITSLAFVPGCEKIVGSSGRELYLWNLGTGKVEAILTGHPNQITCLAVSHDGRFLASADVFGCIKLWQTSSPQELATLQDLWPKRSGPIPGWTATLAFAPDGRTLASSTLPKQSKEQRGRIKLWDAVTRQEITLPR